MKNSNSKQMHSIYSTSVVEIKSSGTSANALIARGAFGRVDIALLVQRQHTSNQQSSSSNIHSISLAAIKTIPNATTNSGRSTEYTNLAKLTREAFAELNSLRLLNGHENVTPLIHREMDSMDGIGLKMQGVRRPLLCVWCFRITPLTCMKR
jgi:hypothetical protein